MAIQLEPATLENFDEERYLLANKDIAAQVKAGSLESGWAHFRLYGIQEGRTIAVAASSAIGDAAAFYESRAPSAENALDLFRGAWSSEIPGHGYGRAGSFSSTLIPWFLEQVGSIAGASVLELSPLEAGHTYQLCQAGARVTAIEGHAGSYLKCLIVKETFDLPARFLFGDVMAYLDQFGRPYDYVVAIGVLPNMREPLEMVERLSNITNNLLIWTKYYDPAAVNADPDLARKFGPAVQQDFRGVDIEHHPYNDSGAATATEESSMWLTREGILTALKALGFGDIVVGEEGAGPALSLVARR